MEENKKTDNYYLSFNEEDMKRLSRMLMLSRAESGLSQEKVALELGIARKTVQNWEKGSSAPTLPQAIAWFKVMKISAMPYFIQFMFPDMEVVGKKTDDKKLRAELIEMIETLPTEGIKQLTYLLCGNHGSSPRAILNLITAYLNTNMSDRYKNAYSIVENYKLSCDSNNNKKVANVNAVPDIQLLDKALDRSRKAIIEGKESYMLIDE